MKAVLLTTNAFLQVPAGVEKFSQLLQKSFPGLKIIYLEKSQASSVPFLKEPFNAKKLAQKLEQRISVLKPDIVFFNGLNGWALPSKTPYLKIGICHGTFVSFAKNALPWSLNRLRTQFVFSWFEKKSFQNADFVVSNSAFTKKILKKDYGINSAFIPLGVDTAIFKSRDKKQAQKKLGLPNNKKIILFVGRPHYSKGFDWVKKLAQKRRDWHFVSVTFPKADSAFLDCHPPVSQSILAEFYSASDVVFFPSRFESFGLVTMEALASQVPVVTTSFGIASDFLHPFCIVVFNPSLKAFEQAIEKAFLLQNSSFSKIEQNFGLNSFAKQYQKLVKSLLQKKKEKLIS